MTRPTSITARRLHEDALYSYAPAGQSAPPPPPPPDPAPEYRANAGHPGNFTGGPVPPNMSVLIGAMVKAWPATAWGRHDYIRVGDTREYTWTGDRWHVAQLVGPGDDVTDSDVVHAISTSGSYTQALALLNGRGGFGPDDLELVPDPCGAWESGEAMTIDGNPFHYNGTAWQYGVTA